MEQVGTPRQLHSKARWRALVCALFKDGCVLAHGTLQLSVSDGLEQSQRMLEERELSTRRIDEVLQVDAEALGVAQEEPVAHAVRQRAHAMHERAHMRRGRAARPRWLHEAIRRRKCELAAAVLVLGVECDLHRALRVVAVEGNALVRGGDAAELDRVVRRAEGRTKPLELRHANERLECLISEGQTDVERLRRRARCCMLVERADERGARRGIQQLVVADAWMLVGGAAQERDQGARLLRRAERVREEGDARRAQVRTEECGERRRDAHRVHRPSVDEAVTVGWNVGGFERL